MFLAKLETNWRFAFQQKPFLLPWQLPSAQACTGQSKGAAPLRRTNPGSYSPFSVLENLCFIPKQRCLVGTVRGRAAPCSPILMVTWGRGWPLPTGVAARALQPPRSYVFRGQGWVPTPTHASPCPAAGFERHAGAEIRAAEWLARGRHPAPWGTSGCPPVPLLHSKDSVSGQGEGMCERGRAMTLELAALLGFAPRVFC